MAKAKKGSKNNPITKQDKIELELPEYVIVSAKLNDGKCDFSFRTQKGIHEGEVTNTKGSGIFYDTLRESFNRLAVHLAVIDEVFKHKGIEIEDIDMLHTDETTMNYTVHSFKISGEEDSECIYISGSKYTSLGDMPVNTPKVPLDSLSGYKWYNELKAASDDVRREVAEYKEGHFEVPEKEEKPTGKQLKIGEVIDEQEFANAAM